MAALALYNTIAPMSLSLVKVVTYWVAATVFLALRAGYMSVTMSSWCNDTRCHIVVANNKHLPHMSCFCV